MPRKTAPFQHYPPWTTARFFGFLRSGLREKFNRYPVKYEMLRTAAQDMETGEVYKTGARAGQAKTVKMYVCAECLEYKRQTEIQVDHIIPAGSLKCFEDLGPFAERLFCGPDGLQILCKDCHTTKTKTEKAK